MIYHYIITFSYTHAHNVQCTMHVLLHHYTMCSIACGHTPWPEGDVVLHVNQCLQTCCFVMFIVVSYHTQMLSFSFITCPISQLCAQIRPYYNVLPGAVFVVFTRTTISQTKMLHALQVNPTCLQSLRVWYCSVYQLHEPNQRRRMLEPITKHRSTLYTSK